MQKNSLHSNITSLPEIKYMITIYRIVAMRFKYSIALVLEGSCKVLVDLSFCFYFVSLLQVVLSGELFIRF